LKPAIFLLPGATPESIAEASKMAAIRIMTETLF
jgi:hypothetical protein